VSASRVFLSAEWRYLAMLTYRVEPDVLQPLVPAGTTLDLWRNSPYISIVGFLFQNTRILGVPIPLHRTFEEVNLRFYVRREIDGETRRGVTFIRELVPRIAVAAVARAVYNEPYRALRMRHQIVAGATSGESTAAEYGWTAMRRRAGLRVTTSGPARPLRPDSDEAFITRRQWGYTRQRDGSTVEYEVRHPDWKVWHVAAATLYGEMRDVYPPHFADILTRPPDSAMLADGSPVTVYRPTHLSQVSPVEAPTS
jgi:hypothetical protein